MGYEFSFPHKTRNKDLTKTFAQDLGHGKWDAQKLLHCTVFPILVQLVVEFLFINAAAAALREALSVAFFCSSLVMSVNTHWDMSFSSLNPIAMHLGL